MRRQLVDLLVFAGLLLTSPPVLAQTFELVDLGAIPGSTFASAHAVNEDDVVTGRSGPGGERLFLWDASAGIRDLNAPYPLHTYQAVRMNRAGRIAAVWNRGGLLRPFTWDAGTFTEQPDVASGWVRMMRRITDGGLIQYQGARSSCNMLTAVLLGGVAYRVDQVLGDCWAATDIADGPVVAGYRRSGSGYQPAVRLANGQVVVPGGLANAEVARIGAGGHYAVVSFSADRMYIASPGGPTATLATLPGTVELWPEGLNRFAESVGNAFTAAGASRPFLIRHGQMREMTTAIPGYTLVYFTDINDKGHIAGQARLPNGHYHAVLLRPTDRPQDLQASVGGSQVSLTWAPPVNAPPGATYLLQVGSSSGASNVFSANIGAVTSISGTVPNGVYHARLTLVYASGAFGGISSEVQFSVPAAPRAPTGLTASLSGRTITLSWTPPAGGGVTDYVIEAGSSPGGVDVYNGSVGAVVTVSAPVAPATYHIRVRARNVGGLSAPSNEVVVVVP